jgi:hypothetical protein
MYIAVKRYLALLSGGITEINNGQGKTYYRDSIWYLSIGNTLFRLGASASPDIITNDTIYHTVLSAYNFADTDFTENFGPSPLIAVKITGLPRHGLLKKTGAPVMLNDVIITADLNKLTYEPDAGFAFVDTIQWSGSNGLVYAGNALLKIIVVPLPAKPAFTGIMADYCNGLGLQHVRISNWPDISFTSVKAMLDSTPLTINAADSSFSFNVNGLGAGVHQIRVTFTNIAGTKDSVVSTTIIAAVMPDVNVSANITNIISLTNPVILTASNAAGGGTTPLFTFAKNRTFTDILQTEGTSTTFTINPSALVIGDNKVYVRMKTNATCYTVQADTDSILLKRDATTGIIDPDNPGGTISIAPIPFQNNIRVDGLNSGKKYQLVMSNMRGQIVYSAQVSNKSSISIPATGIVPGAYWLSIYDAKKKLLGTEKVIKY